LPANGNGSPLSKALTAAFVLLYLAAYLVYVVPSLNSPNPSFANMSVTLVYSLLLWVLLIIVVVIAATKVWR